MRAGIFDVVVAIGLEDLGQFPAAVETREPLEVLEADAVIMCHGCRLSIRGGRAEAF